jgi:hypothetical protein
MVIKTLIDWCVKSCKVVQSVIFDAPHSQLICYLSLSQGETHMKIKQTRTLKCTVALGVVLLILCTPISSLSWGAGGHMMTAQIAFDRLNPRAKAQVRKLLAIKVVVKLDDGTKPTLSAKSQAAVAAATAKTRDFVNASHWLDDLRSAEELYDKKNPQNFGDIHFVDTPFSDDGTALPPVPARNILTELNRSVDILKTSTDDNARAQALRFIIHFVGDIHQPLHCATRVRKNQKDGDQGGNFVKDITVAKNLHSYWDGGLGTFPKQGPNFAPPSLASVSTAVKRIVAANPASAAGINLNDPTNFQSWANESFELAKTRAYDGMESGKPPTASYRKEGVKVANQRVAWGGYRLAALLNSIWP